MGTRALPKQNPGPEAVKRYDTASAGRGTTRLQAGRPLLSSI
jgi:hypothetical protein